MMKMPWLRSCPGLHKTSPIGAAPGRSWSGFWAPSQGGPQELHHHPLALADWLLYRGIGDGEVRILMVPLLGDVIEGEPKGLALSWTKRRDFEVPGFGIGAVGFQHLQRHLFLL